MLVNNAGVGIGAAVAEITDQEARPAARRSTCARSILFYRECVDLLRAAGAEHRNALVVNTSSISGKPARRGCRSTAPRRRAVVGFTQAMHKELGAEGIKSTALCPAFVDTPMTDFVKGQVKRRGHDPGPDIAETVRCCCRLSPGCIIPEIQFVRPGDRL